MQTVIDKGRVAVITGAAAGIGLAVAHCLAREGMAIVVADVREDLFGSVTAALTASGATEVVTRLVDVADRAAVNALEREVIKRFGGVDLLMCNAGVQPGSDIFDASASWDHVMATNLGGVVNCCQAFVPGMMSRNEPACVINTGSKQGITTPPGDPAYNVSKAGVKVFTEALQHTLREAGSAVNAHLFVPGFVFTDINRRGRTEKPADAWTPEQVTDFMLNRVSNGDFYIICPDNDVTRATDEKRMAWAMGDVIENRPPLSRWHPEWTQAFNQFMQKG